MNSNPQRSQNPIQGTDPISVASSARAAARQCAKCGAPCADLSKVCRECFENDGAQEKVLAAIREGMQAWKGVRE